MMQCQNNVTESSANAPGYKAASHCRHKYPNHIISTLRDFVCAVRFVIGFTKGQQKRNIWTTRHKENFKHVSLTRPQDQQKRRPVVSSKTGSVYSKVQNCSLKVCDGREVDQWLQPWKHFFPPIRITVSEEWENNEMIEIQYHMKTS